MKLATSVTTVKEMRNALKGHKGDEKILIAIHQTEGTDFPPYIEINIGE